MIKGIGTDIVEIARLAQKLDAIKTHCFTAIELEHAAAFREPAEHLAGRWAAKEAFAKALGTGFGASCAWEDLEIVNDDLGKPQMNLSGKALQTFEKIGGKYIHLSISHEKNYATASVIIEGEK